MHDFKGQLNEEGLSSFNQALFDNMGCFSDIVWVIDVEKEQAEILLDRIEPDTVGRCYSLEELRNRIRSRYPGKNQEIVNRYTAEYLSQLKETVYFLNPAFVIGSRRFKLKNAITPELDAEGKTNRVYISGINMEDFLTSRKENSEIYKTVSMILSHGKDFKKAIPDALQFIGNTLGVSRVYIFENDEYDSNYINNTFEWCSEGIAPQINKLQHVSYEEYGYTELFSMSQLYCCQDKEHANENMRMELESQDIKAMINYAFYNNDDLAGFVGFDDCKKVRPDWMEGNDEVEILTYVADLLTTYLIKERNLAAAKQSEENERELRLKAIENNTLLNHFVNAYSSAYTVDLGHHTFEILHMSHAFQQVFIMDGDEEDMARFVETHIHPDDRELMRKMTNPDHVISIMEKQDECTFTMREIFDGQERTMHGLIMRGVDERHVAIGFMDITAEIQREKEINEKLETANRARRDFLSAMSHDIRTPMNAILGMVEIALNHGDDKEKMTDCLEKIRVSGNHLISLVNDVLDISAIESAKMELRPTPHSVESGVDFIANTHVGIMGGKNLHFSIDQHDIIHPWIMVDEVRLNQIINNLLSNAVKYTPEGGCIKLENYQENDIDGRMWHVIKVSDSGIGMSEEFMERMWDTFSRATDTRINQIQGAGLGLSIVKSLIELMGGDIDVKSRVDRGTTFTVKIPLVPTENPGTAESSMVFDAGDYARHILIVEDNDMNWEIACDLLEVCGVTSDRAENGKVAVEVFTGAPEGTYDAILMDMQMPVMNGLDATRAIRSSQHPEAKTIPIIAMTANAFTEDVEQCKAAGMNEHLSKPIEMDKVMAVLRRHTENGSKHRNS